MKKLIGVLGAALILAATAGCIVAGPGYEPVPGGYPGGPPGGPPIPPPPPGPPGVIIVP
jgi:hypothetical protein